MKILSSRGRKIQENAQKETELLELLRCEVDPKYFMNKYIMKLREPQTRFIDHIQEYKGTVCRHKRAVGMTSASMGYLLWEAMFKPGTIIATVLPNFNAATNAKDMLADMWGQLPKSIGAKMKYHNRNYVEFENGSRIHFTAMREGACRGLSIDTFYLGDLCQADMVLSELVWTLIAPVLGRSSKVICHSSEFNQFHLFADMYREASAGRDHWGALNLE